MSKSGDNKLKEDFNMDIPNKESNVNAKDNKKFGTFLETNIKEENSKDVIMEDLNKNQDAYKDPNNFNIQDKVFFKQIDFTKIKKELIKRSINETMLKIKSIYTDIIIRTDSSDAYIKEKVTYIPRAGKYTKIIKKFSNLGSSQKLESFKLSSAYIIFK